MLGTKNIAGVLVNIGELDIGSFEKQVTQYSKGIAELNRSIVYWVDEGADAGAGRLSYQMAQSARDWIRQAMRGDHSKYVGPPLKPLTKKYAAWKAKVAPGNPVMTLTGTAADSLSVMEKRRRGYAVGISSKAYAQRIVRGKVPLTYSDKKVPVAVYMGYHELNDRPIITGAMLAWTQKMFPEWGRLMEKYMQEQVWGGNYTPPTDTRPSGIAARFSRLADMIERVKSPAAKAKSKMSKLIRGIRAKWLKTFK